MRPTERFPPSYDWLRMPLKANGRVQPEPPPHRPKTAASSRCSDHKN